MKAVYIIMILAVIAVGIFVTNLIAGGGGGIPQSKKTVYVYVRTHSTILCGFPGTEIQDVVIKDEGLCMGDTSTSGDILVSASSNVFKQSVAKNPECNCGYGCDTITMFKFCLQNGGYDITATWRGSSGSETITVS